MKGNSINTKPYHHQQHISPFPLEPNKTLTQSSSSPFKTQASSSSCSPKTYHGETDHGVKHIDFEPTSSDTIHQVGDELKVKEETCYGDYYSGRERLKRHRNEAAGRVWVPDTWGQEELLKDWIDCSGFDAALMTDSIVTARKALVEEGRRGTSARLRVENRY